MIIGASGMQKMKMANQVQIPLRDVFIYLQNNLVKY